MPRYPSKSMQTYPGQQTGPLSQKEGRGRAQSVGSVIDVGILSNGEFTPDGKNTPNARSSTPSHKSQPPLKQAQPQIPAALPTNTQQKVDAVPQTQTLYTETALVFLDAALEEILAQEQVKQIEQARKANAQLINQIVSIVTNDPTHEMLSDAINRFAPKFDRTEGTELFKNNELSKPILRSIVIGKLPSHCPLNNSYSKKYDQEIPKEQQTIEDFVLGVFKKIGDECKQKTTAEQSTEAFKEAIIENYNKIRDRQRTSLFAPFLKYRLREIMSLKEMFKHAASGGRRTEKAIMMVFDGKPKLQNEAMRLLSELRRQIKRLPNKRTKQDAIGIQKTEEALFELYVNLSAQPTPEATRPQAHF